MDRFAKDLIIARRYGPQMINLMLIISKRLSSGYSASSRRCKNARHRNP